MKYVVFLRGINVGGNSKVPMGDLKKILEDLGFSNVKTLLNSGNVVFETERADTKTLRMKLEKRLESEFGFSISVILRTDKEINTLINSEPFKGMSVTPDTRLYITFLLGKPTSNLKIPFETAEKDFKILRVSNGEVVSVLTLSEQRRTPESMNIIEKEYGKKVTTRNWNTILKTAKLLSEF